MIKLDEPLPCGTWYPALPGNDPGWECTGSNLMVVLIAPIDGEDIPVVVPAPMVEHALATIPGLHTPAPFNGGNHFHLRLGDPT